MNSASDRFSFEGVGYPRQGLCHKKLAGIWLPNLLPYRRLNCARYNPKLSIFLLPVLAIGRNEVGFSHRIRSSLMWAVSRLALVYLLGLACSSDAPAGVQTVVIVPDVQSRSDDFREVWIPDAVEATTPKSSS